MGESIRVIRYISGMKYTMIVYNRWDKSGIMTDTIVGLRYIKIG